MRDGTYNKFEILDGAIECLDGIKISGATNVNLLSQVFQMLYALKTGLKNEDNAKAKTIETLKEQLKRATEPHPEGPDGDVVGGQHFDLNYGGADNGAD